MKRPQLDWDVFFLRMAQLVATRSKDPGRKVGAVIASNSNHVMSMGYNGFSADIEDSQRFLQDKELKNRLMVHAEVNAIKHLERQQGVFTLYSTYLPCSVCASRIVAQGFIHRVVVLGAASQYLRSPCSRGPDWGIAINTLAKYKVRLEFIPLGGERE